MKKAADAQYIPGIERLSGPDFTDKMLSEVRPQDNVELFLQYFLRI